MTGLATTNTKHIWTPFVYDRVSASPVATIYNKEDRKSVQAEEWFFGFFPLSTKKALFFCFVAGDVFLFNSEDWIPMYIHI